jgi:hypothetical protein
MTGAAPGTAPNDSGYGSPGTNGTGAGAGTSNMAPGTTAPGYNGNTGNGNAGNGTVVPVMPPSNNQ